MALNRMNQSVRLYAANGIHHQQRSSLFALCMSSLRVFLFDRKHKSNNRIHIYRLLRNRSIFAGVFCLWIVRFYVFRLVVVLRLHVHVLGVLRGSRVHRTTTAHKILANWIAPKSYCIENAENETWKLGRCQWNAQIKRLKITMNHAECHWMFAWKITSKYHHWHTGTNQRTNERICWIGINI